jgi:catechol 2,3-dioxygenase-like lactoylglutathione lyase family enzyme
VADYGVIPSLRVRDMGRTIDFYVEVLGFTLDRGGPDEPNSVVSRESARIMLESAHDFFGAEYNDAIRERVGTPGPNALYIEAQGLAAFHERVAAAGARIVDPIADRAWGQAEFTVEDPDGNWLSFWETPA